ncbi:PGAP2-interacting protein [Biomphalaria pfeifferi]|uniref:PGAP2-interacting protein n=1 Tax=Biomphalaria pfeifferi TaxID=112525 RepID=A0AAD8AV93_BIOPF|nr:PGAP2-interacting protein [Biomphalaria pfeifferi]
MATSKRKDDGTDATNGHYNSEKEKHSSYKRSKNQKKLPIRIEQSTSELIISIIRDGIDGFIFWSIFQALAAMIWFFPLNELEISGYEAFAAVWLSPVLCLVPGVHSFLQEKKVLIVMRLLTVVCLASFQASTTLSRLVILAIGAGVSMLVLAATLWHSSMAIRYRTYWSLILGLNVFLASRVWYLTFVPTWWDNMTNSIVIAFGVISVISSSLEDVYKSQDKVPVLSSSLKSVACGIGLGSILYLTHMCLGEASLITRWTVKSYPDTGPLPLPWGSCVLVAVLLGSLVRIQIAPLVTVVAATLCIYTLLLCPNPWLGFTAGCVLAYLIMCLWPVVIDSLTECKPGVCLTVASITYIFQVLFWVWTVAFNFVPYGEYTREHTDWLLGLVMAGVALLVLCSNSSPGCVTQYDKKDKSVPSCTLYAKVIFLVFLIGQLGMYQRCIKYKPGPSDKPNPKMFTAAIWTYHFGYDNRGWPSMERAATMLNDTGADVITLLESDASKPFLGNNDLATWLAEKLNFYVDFGPSTKDHTWGNLILSKYPIVKSTHHLLPSPHGELAPAVTASINISGTIVEFVVTHMGNDRDVLDRKLQAEFLAKELKNSLNPAVFLGYVTSAPRSENYYHLLREGHMKDIDPTDEDRWCQYIMYKKLIRLGYARISHGGLSDTEVQLGTFQIPDNLNDYEDKEKVTISPKRQQIDATILFNEKFGSYHKGHGYFSYHGFHMGTPKYFYN